MCSFIADISWLLLLALQEAIEALVADLQKHHVTSYAIADGPRGKNKLFLAAFSDVSREPRLEE